MTDDLRRTFQFAMVCHTDFLKDQNLPASMQSWFEERGYHTVFHDYHEGEDFLHAWQNKQFFDFLIFGLRGGDSTGFALAEEIRKHDLLMPLVFVADSAERIRDGFEVNALHYLVSPIEKDCFEDTMQRGWKKISERRSELSMPLSKPRLYFIMESAWPCGTALIRRLLTKRKP